MQKSFDQLKQWLQQQTQKRQAAQVYTAIDGVNDRQGYLLRLFTDQPSRDIRVKEAATRFNVTSHTARADLQNLVELGLLREIALDKKTKSYVRVSNFDELLHKMMK
jgi:Fic family protein